MQKSNLTEPKENSSSVLGKMVLENDERKVLPGIQNYFRKIQPQFTPFDAYISNLVETKINTYRVNDSSNFKSEQVFNNQDLFYLKFKVNILNNNNNNNNQNLLIGIANAKWSSNYFYFFESGQSVGKGDEHYDVEKNKIHSYINLNLKEKDGQIFEMFCCVQEGLLQIQTGDQKGIQKLDCSFSPKKNDKWMIVFGIEKDTEIEIL